MLSYWEKERKRKRGKKKKKKVQRCPKCAKKPNFITIVTPNTHDCIQTTYIIPKIIFSDARDNFFDHSLTFFTLHYHFTTLTLYLPHVCVTKKLQMKLKMLYDFKLSERRFNYDYYFTKLLFPKLTPPKNPPSLEKLHIYLKSRRKSRKYTEFEVNRLNFKPSTDLLNCN